MAKFLYAFFKSGSGQDVVAICPKDEWESTDHLSDSYSDEERSTLQPILDKMNMMEHSECVFEWGPANQVFDIKSEFDNHPDLFEGSEDLRAYCQDDMGYDEDDDEKAPVTQAVVPQPAPQPEPQPAQQAPCSCAAAPKDCMRIQIGNHTIEIPMDVQTAMMLAQTFQAYAQYQIVVGQFQQGLQHPIGQQTATQQPAASPAPAKIKSVPETPDTAIFGLSNSMRGEFLDVHGKSVVKIEQGGKLIAETKACDTREEAYDIAKRFARMIPGLTKPDEIIRK
jgi:hypothetical protein